MFKAINLNNWKRNIYYKHFTQNVTCTYSICTKIDITKIKELNLKISPTIIFLISKLVNSHEEFRIATNAKGIVGIYDKLDPLYTYFNSETETFTNIWSKYSDNYQEFLKGYIKDTEEYKNSKDIIANPQTPENIFNISIIPWINFEGFNLNIKKGYDYLLPIFTIGKYTEENGKILIPISIQVHHAVCDGFHISRFINELQDIINKGIY